MTSASTYSESVQDGRSQDPDFFIPDLEPPLQVEANSLPEKQMPDLETACLLHGKTPVQNAVLVIAHKDALATIQAHSTSDMGVELGGALLGQAYRSGKQMVLEIKAALPVASQDHGPVHFTFSADSWAQIQADKAAQYPNLDIVGWFHTHPNLGVFYSSDDVVVHSAAFTLPWHVGLVVDPVRNEAAFFGWIAQTLAPFAGFYEKLGPSQQTAVPWRVVQTAVWDHPYTVPHTPRAAAVASPRTAAATSLPLRRNSGWLLGVAIAVLTFFFLAGWIAVLNRQVTQLETAVNTMATTALPAEHLTTCPDPNLRVLSPLTATRVPAGERVTLLGTADVLSAARYQVQIRPSGSEQWSTVATRRSATEFGQVGVWRTQNVTPGSYELRLIAVDRNSVRLSNAIPCQLQLELIP